MDDPDAFGDMDEECDDMEIQSNGCPFDEPMSAEVVEKKDEVSSCSPIITDNKKGVGGAANAFDDPDAFGDMDAEWDDMPEEEDLPSEDQMSDAPEEKEHAEASGSPGPADSKKSAPSLIERVLWAFERLFRDA